MMVLDAEQAGSALGIGSLLASVKGVSIDSRTLQPGDLFVALRGERFDGHDYVEAAFAAGASGAIVDERVWRERAEQTRTRRAGPISGAGETSCGPGPLYEVPDTLAALGALAREVRRISEVTVFAITGSVGKTSTKDMLKAMVGRVRRVVATTGNQNNEVGVPLTLLGVAPDTEAVIVEMGMRGLGQISDLVAIAEPDVGVITNIQPVHLELLGSIDNVAKAKAELILGIKPDGAAVVPANCDSLEPLLKGCSCRLVRFGVEEDQHGVVSGHPQISGADTVGWLEPGDAAGRYVWALKWPGGESRVPVDYMARHALENAVAAAAACYVAGLPVEECMAGIGDVELSEGRGQLTDVGGLCVIDDTYNANPAAVHAAIDNLVRVAHERRGRAVAVLGDMLELGADSTVYHERAGEYAAAAGVTVLWGVGPMAAGIAEGFRRWWNEHAAAGQHWSVEHLDSCDKADKIVAGLLVGDVVLVKGSRGVRLENVAAGIASEGNAGRWGGGNRRVDVDGDSNGEKRRC